MNTKCRYNRNHFSVKQIKELVKKYNNSQKYKSLFSEKLFDSEYKWRNDIIRRLDSESCNIFFWFIEPIINNCKYCGIKLNYNEYSYGGKEFGFKGFKKYCLKCEDSGIWKKQKRTELQCKNISNGLKSWSKTKDGKKYYKKRGEENSIFMKTFLKTDLGIKIRNKLNKKVSKSIRKKIKDGSFTPNITNSWTHWNAKIKIKGKIKKFRSSWEACFYVCHPELKYEFIRIPYNNKTYIGDFYDDKNKILYEIKPRSSYNTQVEKISKVIEFCKINKIKFIWINENNILKYIDESKIIGYNRKQYDKMIKGL